MSDKKTIKFTQSSIFDVWRTRKELAVKEEGHETFFGCPICSFDLSKFTLDARTLHVNRCIDPLDVVKDEIRTVKIEEIDTVTTTTKSKKRQTPQRKPSVKRGKKQKPPIPEHKILNFNNDANIIAVDAFCYAPNDQISVYLLTHFHSDHYGGLSKSWFDVSGAKYVLCTPVTGKLLTQRYGMGESCQLLETPLGEWIGIPQSEIEVLALDANHCPGAGIFIIKCKEDIYLHCGDFRVCASMIDRLKGYQFKKCYLDTTYLDPMYSFPKQNDVVMNTSQWIKEKVMNYKSNQLRIFDYIKPNGSSNEFLIVVGSYSIGKERLALSIAKALDSKIFCTKDRFKTMSTYDWPELTTRLDTESPLECNVHLVSMGKTNKDLMKEYLGLHSSKFKSVLVVYPTGWSFNWRKKDDTNEGDDAKTELGKFIETDSGKEIEIMKRTLEGGFNVNKKQDFITYRKVTVPYSEHSSFRELFYFVNLLRCDEWITTVNKNKDKMQMLWIKEFSNFPNLELEDL